MYTLDQSSPVLAPLCHSAQSDLYTVLVLSFMGGKKTFSPLSHGPSPAPSLHHSITGQAHTQLHNARTNVIVNDVQCSNPSSTVHTLLNTHRTDAYTTPPRIACTSCSRCRPKLPGMGPTVSLACTRHPMARRPKCEGRHRCLCFSCTPQRPRARGR